MGLEEFQILSRLGEGAFSSVWKVRRFSDGMEYAMKKVKMSKLTEKEKLNALNEVRILASIKSPYIIGYKEAFFEDNSMNLCIVMEYAGGGDIFNKIVQHQKAKTHFKEEEIWNYAIQLTMGLKTLHDMKILHRDLKAANLFLSKDGKTVKLGDLNVSKVAKTNLVYTQTGTPYYASPEVWRDQPYDFKSDIWSLGCLLYELCALNPPFRAHDMEALYKKVQKGVFERIPSQYSADLHTLISACLQVSPQMRPSCNKLLNHPLLRKHGAEFFQTSTSLFTESNELLGTIKIPRNIKTLGDILPKSNYNEDSPSEMSKRSILLKTEDDEKQSSNLQSKRNSTQHLSDLMDETKKRNQSSTRRRQPSQKLDRLNAVSNIEGRKSYSIKPQKENIRKESDHLSKPKLVDSIDLNINRKQILKEKSHEIAVSSQKAVLKKDDDFLNPHHHNIYREKHKARANSISEKAHANNIYLPNKYLNIETEDKYSSQKYSERPSLNLDEVLSRKAENIVKKYYADAISAEKREPLIETKKLNENLLNIGVVRDAIDILNKYNHISRPRDSSNPRIHPRSYLENVQGNKGLNELKNINAQPIQKLQIPIRGLPKPPNPLNKIYH